MAGGYTRLLPAEDRYYYSRSRRSRTMLAFALGGRVAEEIVFGEITTGAANDIERGDPAWPATWSRSTA